MMYFQEIVGKGFYLKLVIPRYKSKHYETIWFIESVDSNRRFNLYSIEEDLAKTLRIWAYEGLA